MKLAYDLAFLAGAGVVVAGVAMWSTPAAMVLGGAALSSLSVALRLAKRNRDHGRR